MQRTLEFVHQGHDAIVIQSRPHPKGSSADDKRRNWLALPPQVQGCSEQVVDNFLKWAAGSANLGPHRRGHIIVKGKRGSHIVTLYIRHQDVNERTD